MSRLVHTPREYCKHLIRHSRVLPDFPMFQCLRGRCMTHEHSDLLLVNSHVPLRALLLRRGSIFPQQQRPSRKFPAVRAAIRHCTSPLPSHPIPQPSNQFKSSIECMAIHKRRHRILGRGGKDMDRPHHTQRPAAAATYQSATSSVCARWRRAGPEDAAIPRPSTSASFHPSIAALYEWAGADYGDGGGRIYLKARCCILLSTSRAQSGRTRRVSLLVPQIQVCWPPWYERCWF